MMVLFIKKLENVLVIRTSYAVPEFESPRRRKNVLC